MSSRSLKPLAEKAAERAAKGECKLHGVYKLPLQPPHKRPPLVEASETTNDDDNAIAPEHETKDKKLLRFNAATISSCQHVETLIV